LEHGGKGTGREGPESVLEKPFSNEGASATIEQGGRRDGIMD